MGHKVNKPDHRTYGIVPNSSAGNQYIDRMHSLLASLGLANAYKQPIFTVIKCNPFIVFSNKRVDLLLVNWHENYLRGRDNRFSVIGLFKFMIVLAAYRIVSKRLVYVRHNVYPHGMTSNGARLARYVSDIAARIADVRVAHSGHLCVTGYLYVPHPLYKVECNFDSISSLGTEKYFVAFGRIERYKNIHKLLHLWRGVDADLIIAGPCEDEDYCNELKLICKNMSNVKIQAEFLQAPNAQVLVANSQALITLHADEDMIVSGSFFFAASLGVPIVSQSTDFLRWVLKEKLYDGLSVFDNDECLIQLLSEVSAREIDRTKLREQANNSFGDAICESALNVLMN